MENKYITALIRTARGEVGYLEKATNAHLEDKTANAGKANLTKYGAWYGAGKNGFPWCAVFVSWCAAQAGIPTSVIPKYHSCGEAIGWFKRRGRWRDRAGYIPKAGDIIFFQNGDDRHTGIVTGYDGVKVSAVEGNTSGGSTMVSNGGGVAEKHYSPLYTRILGYGTPDYDAISGAVIVPPKPPELKSYLRRGSKGDAVRTLQERLNRLGCNCGPVDGDFGPRTLEAVKAFQAARGLVVDGIVGPKTWAKLWE